MSKLVITICIIQSGCHVVARVFWVQQRPPLVLSDVLDLRNTLRKSLLHCRSTGFLQILNI